MEGMRGREKNMIIYLLYETSDLIGAYAEHNTALQEISVRLTKHIQEAKKLKVEPFIEALDYSIEPIRVKN